MLEFITNHLPWLWLALAVVFALVEGCTMALTTIWFAAAALLTAFVAFAPLPFWAQALVFLALSAALLLLCRKAALKWFGKHREQTNVNALIGKTGVITKGAAKFEKGQAKIAGQVWTVKAADGRPLEKGAECTVQAVEGVTAVVLPRPGEG